MYSDKNIYIIQGVTRGRGGRYHIVMQPR